MSRAKTVFGVLGATVLMVGAAAAQGIELPAGPGREVVSRECQACHDLAMVVGSTGLTREGWSGVIDEMTSYGLNVTPQQRTQILDYLSKYLGRPSEPGNAAR
jgi:virginiamycin B lyase